ncbi:unnamed protein product [Rhodiola kirilowii]
METRSKCVYSHGPIIVGAGPSSLAEAACLSQQGISSIILERSDCIASLWQNRAYDRLKLHLPKHFCQLPLMNFPSDFPQYPSKQQFISYMESYAAHFDIKPQFNQAVIEAAFDQASGLWNVTCEDSVYLSRWLIVATGENAEAMIPEINGLEKFQGIVKHTSFYKSGFEFEKQKVLVIGCVNSGIASITDMLIRCYQQRLNLIRSGLGLFGNIMLHDCLFWRKNVTKLKPLLARAF